MKKVLAIIILMLCLVLVGCKSYKDTNGPDDYSLENITEEMILKGRGSSSVGMVSSKDVDGKKTTIKEKVAKFNGVKTLYTLEAGVNCRVFLSSSVSKGNARIVLATDTGIMGDFLVNGADQSFRSFESEYKIYIIIAGEDCSYEIELIVDKD